MRRPYRVKRADPVPLYDALQDALEQLAHATSCMPPGWENTPEGLRVRGALWRGVEAMAQAAGVPPGFLQDGHPALH